LTLGLHNYSIPKFLVGSEYFVLAGLAQTTDFILTKANGVTKVTRVDPDIAEGAHTHCLTCGLSGEHDVYWLGHTSSLAAQGQKSRVVGCD
jgi:hypothetical protein